MDLKRGRHDEEKEKKRERKKKKKVEKKREGRFMFATKTNSYAHFNATGE